MTKLGRGEVKIIKKSLGEFSVKAFTFKMGDTTMPWYIPLVIFLSRIVDVSLGTFRTILVVRGEKYGAALISFFELSIWILAISGTLVYIRNPFALIAYSGGFAIGTIIGIYLENRAAIGKQAMRIINAESNLNVSNYLRKKEYAVTTVDAHGMKGDVELCFVVVPRKEMENLKNAVLQYAHNAFITTENLVETSGGILRNEFSKLPAWMKIIKR